MKIPTKPTQPSGIKPSNLASNRKNILRGITIFSVIAIAVIGVFTYMRGSNDTKDPKPIASDVVNNDGSVASLDSLSPVKEKSGIAVNQGHPDDTLVAINSPRIVADTSIAKQSPDRTQLASTVSNPPTKHPNAVPEAYPVSKPPKTGAPIAYEKTVATGVGSGTGIKTGTAVQVIRGDRQIIKSGELESALGKAVIYASIKVSPEGIGVFNNFEKGSTNHNAEYKNTIIKYLSKTRFNQTTGESMVTVKFTFESAK